MDLSVDPRMAKDEEVEGVRNYKQRLASNLDVTGKGQI